MNTLVTNEREFALKVLITPEARKFFRRWRRLATTSTTAWSDIRTDTYVAGGKTYAGAELIALLRKHLAFLQQHRCCYCRRVLAGIAYARPIEHVLPKKVYRQYTFSYRNLAVACFDCNHVKLDDNWSTWPASRKQYLTPRSCNSFFHPRFHDYNAHVRFLHLDTNGASISVYAGLTPQGRHLCATLLQKSAGRALATSANARFSAAMDKLRGQVELMAQATDDNHLIKFMEELELAANPP